MRREVIFEILKKLEAKKDLKRRLKVFVIIGVIGFFIVGAIAMWIGFKTVSFVATKTKEVDPTSVVKVHTENFKSELTSISKHQVVSCWSKAQSLIAVQVWLERSAMDNLVDLKATCLENNSSAAQNVDIPEKQNNK
jgi:hypothetical protein